ncbi:hypothetical protein L1887_07778 [Cichorium endivia]|nr:hypothetical protein L1887_07778 [Cichorium endivia]
MFCSVGKEGESCWQRLPPPPVPYCSPLHPPTGNKDKTAIKVPDGKDIESIVMIGVKPSIGICLCMSTPGAYSRKPKIMNEWSSQHTQGNFLIVKIRSLQL